ncbi:Bifunctional solanapyrone synthase like protein [Verticillium longisporum]|nr:Bifunctional solanapyrone synthase like protein [Verticillium longisporum]
MRVITDAFSLQCEALVSAGLGDQVLAMADAAYEARLESWWSSSSRLRPAGIVRPKNAQDVAKIVSVLGQNTTGDFAVRSGGHSHWAGGNNIDGGVTVDLGHLRATKYNTETGIASIEPASRWADAFLTLERSGVAVPGGRDGNVGIGGFLTGGGNSYYTGLYGFGCDSVVNAEIVLADGSIIDANKDSHPDLLKALKGGWGNFGIVTRFDLETFPSKPLWGGIRASENSHTVAVGAAMVNFTANYHKNPDAAYLINFTYNPGINVCFTLTFKNDERVIQKSAELREKLVAEMLKTVPTNDLGTQNLFQPIPKFSAEIGESRGGNVLGLDQVEGDSLMGLLACTVREPEHEKLLHEKGLEMKVALEEFANSIDALRPWVYINYADPTQDPISSYGKANVEFLQKVSAKYDPTGMFQRRMRSGFKLPAAAN